jgi:predicted dehydrogenase
MGRRHALAISALQRTRPELEVVAVVDRDPIRSAEVADLLGATGQRPTVATDLTEVVDQVDAVDVVLPTSLHIDQVALALQSGKHVLVEKPLTLKAHEAWELADLATSKGLVLAVAENFRRIPANRALHHLLDSGSLGEVQYMRTQMRAATWAELSADAGAWYQNAAVSGSYPVFELGAHEMDLTQYFFGEVETVYATAVDKDRSAAEAQNVLIALSCASGVEVQIALSVSASPPTFASREIVCSQGRVASGEWEAWSHGSYETVDGAVVPSADYVDTYLADLGPSDAQLRAGTFSAGAPYVDRSEPLRYGTVSALDDFAAAIADGRAPEVDGYAGARTVAICQAVLESVSTGKPIATSEILVAANGRA